jgi:hypothetical protein
MVFTALILGFLGSWHCAGMCCPLTMLVSRNQGFSHKLLYNSSRILVYAAMGMLAATTGSLPFLKTFHTPITLIFGGVFVVLGLSILFRINFLKNFQIDSALTRMLHKVFGHWMREKNFFKPIVLGAMNGLLPCGLTYLAMAYCFVLTPLEGFSFMILFGLGTWPVMIGWESFAQFIARHISFHKIKIAMLLIAGLTLLGRGLTMKLDKGHLSINTVETVCE